jgi:hypothetical protein
VLEFKRKREKIGVERQTLGIAPSFSKITLTVPRHHTLKKGLHHTILESNRAVNSSSFNHRHHRKKNLRSLFIGI